MPAPLESLKKIYEAKKAQIKKQLHSFRRVFSESDERIFEELCFCLLTPQSKAKKCDGAVRTLSNSGFLLNGTEEQIKNTLRKCVRFHNNKARYILNARKLFTEDGRLRIKKLLAEHKTNIELRDWLVENVKGVGMKEASHFLRNIGNGKNLAILDRHIMKNLKELGVVESTEIASMKKYLEYEKRMRAFSKRIGIPLEELDLLLWSEETGEIFK
ncbi:N-glycosylase/DNA lyase [Candidatus Micrarchaeota archaeon]|nr:N-glycosylase/DNA lyase [Candidatus Micrarchaeota archaeon]